MSFKFRNHKVIPHFIRFKILLFRLHYWVTSTTIFAASAVAFAKQYFGDPIECIFVSNHKSKSHLDYNVITQYTSINWQGNTKPILGVWTLQKNVGELRRLIYKEAEKGHQKISFLSQATIQVIDSVKKMNPMYFLALK